MNELYTFTVPIFIKTLGGLKVVLAKGASYAVEQGISEERALSERLAPDMFPLVKQVQVVCDNAKGAAARLAGVEVPKKEDTETTFAELQARIDWTLEYLASIPEESFAGAADRQIILPYFPTMYMTGFDYAREYALPNFFFHVVTAYGLIRKMGAPIGKADIANNPTFHPLA